MRCFSFLFCFIGIAYLQAQELYQVRRWDGVEVRQANNSTLGYPFTGGLNNPQVSSCDLDNDGIRDLFIFDRTGAKPMAFRHTGGIGFNYEFAPDLVNSFPKNVERWALMRDYNCDGIEDLFSFSVNYLSGDMGIRVQEGRRNNEDLLYFVEVADMLRSDIPNSSNTKIITVSNIDIPAIDDIDNDGDLDVLTFHPMGGYVEWYSNQSQELGYGCDSLIFLQTDDCWGRFYESGLSEYLSLSPNIDSCNGKAGWSPLLRHSLHAGSTLLTIDMDNDNDKELFLGDLSFSSITMMHNAGDAEHAWADNQTVFFPTNTTPVDVDIFPAGFFVDANNDGKRDLLVAPNAESNSVNDKVLWYYINTQSDTLPSFDFLQNNFLVKNTLDFGASSKPTFVDYDQDGLTDIVVGNFGVYEGIGDYASSLVLLKNIGTATQPVFKITNTDVGGLLIEELRYLAPTFGDLDADGDMDMVVGIEDGTLLYLENKGSAAVPSYPNIRINYELIDVGLSSSPILADLDGDGDLDLVVGERNGNFNYFPNIGTAAVADFSNVPSSQTFGMVDAKTPGYFEGNAMGCLAQDNSGKWQFFVGNSNGDIWHYDSIENNLQGAFAPVIDGVWAMDEGDYTAPAAADINGDGYLDILVGNRRGGLTLWQYDTTWLVATPNVLPQNLDEYSIFPNPAQNGYFTLRTNNSAQTTAAVLCIIDVLGRQHLQQNVVLQPNTAIQIDVKGLPAGMYYVQVNRKVLPLVLR